MVSPPTLLAHAFFTPFEKPTLLFEEKEFNVWHLIFEKRIWETPGCFLVRIGIRLLLSKWLCAHAGLFMGEVQ